MMMKRLREGAAALAGAAEGCAACEAGVEGGAAAAAGTESWAMVAVVDMVGAFEANRPPGRSPRSDADRAPSIARRSEKLVVSRGLDGRGPAGAGACRPGAGPPGRARRLREASLPGQ